MHQYHPKYLPIDDGKTLFSLHRCFANAKAQNLVDKVSSQFSESEVCSKRPSENLFNLDTFGANLPTDILEVLSPQQILTEKFFTGTWRIRHQI